MTAHISVNLSRFVQNLIFTSVTLAV